MLVTMGLLALTWRPGHALANGPSAHLWISDDALTHLPEGPLAEFLARPELRPMLRNGSIFPDGGYPLGDDYAEYAHWEPLQGAYLEWTIASYDPPYTGEAAEHLAFLLGMASHSMADQVFDSLYIERVKVYDGSAAEFDTASDIVMMSQVEPISPPRDWVPYQRFDQLYDEVHGYDVDPAVMMEGQSLLRIAVNAVATLSQLPAQVAEQALPFPWGSEHLLDGQVPGSPPHEAKVVARYWRALWALAHGQELPGPVLATVPVDGSSQHATDASSIESWVTVIFARGIDTWELQAADFELAPEGGEPVAIDIWHYYGHEHASVVHIQPEADLATDTVYELRVAPGVLTIHGDALAGYAFRFSTGDVGPEPTVPEWPADHDPRPGPGPGPGETGEDTGTDESDEGDTGTDSPHDDTGSDDADDDAPGTGSGGEAAGSGEPAGCSCASDTGTRAGRVTTGWLALLGLGLGLRRIRQPRRTA